MQYANAIFLLKVFFDMPYFLATNSSVLSKVPVWDFGESVEISTFSFFPFNTLSLPPLDFFKASYVFLYDLAISISVTFSLWILLCAIKRVASTSSQSTIIAFAVATPPSLANSFRQSTLV